MKIKNAATFLLVASILGILVELYWSIKNFEYYSRDLVELFIRLLSLTLPIALLILSIALKSIKSDDRSNIISESTSPNELADTPSVGDWLVNFLITIIPLIGFIFIIIWANDDKNKVRKNWAIASLIWMGIILVLGVFMYAAIFASLMNRY